MQYWCSPKPNPLNFSLTEQFELEKEKLEVEPFLLLPGLKRTKEEWLLESKQEDKVKKEEEKVDGVEKKTDRAADFTNRSIATTIMWGGPNTRSVRSGAGEPITRDGLFLDSEGSGAIGFENDDLGESGVEESSLRSPIPESGKESEHDDQSRKSVSRFHRPGKLEPQEEPEVPEGEGYRQEIARGSLVQRYECI